MSDFSDKSHVTLVWFKKDLRVVDHAPLVAAQQQGQLFCIYCYEPSLYQSPDFDPSHLVFTNQCLAELQDALNQAGIKLHFYHGEVVSIFERLREQFQIVALHSHEETGNWVSYQRDLAVATWAKSHGIRWREWPQTGVIRPLKKREGWAQKWDRRMGMPLLEAPTNLTGPEDSRALSILTPKDLGLPDSTKIHAQVGGRSQGLKTLHSFFTERGQHYQKAMSHPLSAQSACSRISTYLTYGALSMKEAYQVISQYQNHLDQQSIMSYSDKKLWRAAYRSYEKRLHWHCHFMQKLEDEPEIEWQNMNHLYDNLRPDAHLQPERFEAWQKGLTGYPLVDACMRSLHQTGWLTFRMRAMLASFSAYHLWLHWPEPSQYLARQFIDYEPGIHYSQFQMQSGTTGINAIRIYSPTKQVLDNDPEGHFIRQYVPELEHVPLEFLAEPHTMPPLLQLMVGCVIGKNYPAPIVDHKTAYQFAQKQMFAIRKQPTHRIEAEQVLRKHGSRFRSSLTERMSQ